MARLEEKHLHRRERSCKFRENVEKKGKIHVYAVRKDRPNKAGCCKPAAERFLVGQIKFGRSSPGLR